MKYHQGDIVTGYVSGIQDYGIFVQFENGENGLIHISQISDKFVKNIHGYAELGEVIRVLILNDGEQGHYQLGIKNLDYRIMKSRGSKIEETPSGFKNLALSLEKWIWEKANQQKNEQN